MTNCRKPCPEHTVCPVEPELQARPEEKVSVSHKCSGPCCDGWREILESKNERIKSLESERNEYSHLADKNGAAIMANFAIAQAAKAKIKSLEVSLLAMGNGHDWHGHLEATEVALASAERRLEMAILAIDEARAHDCLACEKGRPCGLGRAIASFDAAGQSEKKI